MVDSVVIRKWGNSLGLTLPKNLAESQKIRPNDRVIVSVKKVSSIKDLFGSLKTNKSTENILKEIDEGWD